MTNKLVVIINSLKVPKIKKILLYEMKFLVPNYSCLQNPWLGGYHAPYSRSLCLLSSTEFVESPPQTKFLGTPLAYMMVFWDHTPRRIVSDSAYISEKHAASICKVNELDSDGTCFTNLHGASTQQAWRVPILSFQLKEYALISQP